MRRKMQLKTLKDLTLTEVAKEEVKQEAIKWVKQLRFNKQFTTAQEFMVFHNITEEDLSDDQPKGGKPK